MAYEILVFIHILSATLWLGGGIVMELLHLRLGTSPTTEQLRDFFSMSHWISPRLFMPAALSTLISGVALVFMGGAGWGDTWIIIAIVGVVITVAIGATQIGPTVARISALMDSGDPSAIAPLTRKLALVTRIDLAILLLVLFDMVFKPMF